MTLRLPLAVALASGALTATLSFGACSDFRRSSGTVDDASTDGGASTDAASAPDSPFAIYSEDPDAGAFHAVWAASPQDVFAVGDDGMISEMVQGQWYAPLIGQGYDLTGVWGASASDVYAVGTLRNTDKGIILRREAGTWIETASTPHGLRSVWGIGDVRYAIGFDGVIYSGPSKNPFSSGLQVDLNAGLLPTTYAPILYSIGGNDPSNVMIAADVLLGRDDVAQLRRLHRQDADLPGDLRRPRGARRGA